MHPYSVIIKPVLSEKSNDVRENEGKYTFVIRRDATKEDVKKAVSKLWDVKVAKVQTLITRGKIKRRGMNFSKPTKTKKAVVTLAEGAKLPLFEEQ
ncbi:50S ribosomal protein L23 [Pseudobacteriovorax antillogorgiicola]|uniref:Large ribosomal subunit protein uL23 n=1 Tax=Pseudobacteriovorax antillogorgiicola TaxID=1513793 RepID=A0A1Y6B7Y0_9BACT|nr:50S ribosomal protein L23 [Pseudobacteriovorax antillogorgiicola]TCS59364.1 LSU ribosomal protein L23P [Pseudobacteriovorax antillogorgiicola]SME88975.1 LSU ribosomal protein L23P [Pseudobacteriovorax antillogorgiicola]